MKYKSKNLEKFKVSKIKIEIKKNNKKIYLRIEQDRKYLSTNFSTYSKNHRIKQLLIMAYALQQNNVREHIKKTIIERTKLMVATNNCLGILWMELINAINLFINISPTYINYNKTPKR